MKYIITALSALFLIVPGFMELKLKLSGNTTKSSYQVADLESGLAVDNNNGIISGGYASYPHAIFQSENVRSMAEVTEDTYVSEVIYPYYSSDPELSGDYNTFRVLVKEDVYTRFGDIPKQVVYKESLSGVFLDCLLYTSPSPRDA